MLRQAFIDFDTKNNDKNPTFEVGDEVRIPKCKKVFEKVYTPNSCEKNFMIKNVKNKFPQTYVIEKVNGEEIVETLFKKDLKKVNQTEFRIEKVIKM